MNNRQKRVQRQGRIYRFSIAETMYAAFIWQHGKQFAGRIEGEPGIPQCTGSTALSVRNALQQWLITHVVA